MTLDSVRHLVDEGLLDEARAVLDKLLTNSEESKESYELLLDIHLRKNNYQAEITTKYQFADFLSRQNQAELSINYLLQIFPAGGELNFDFANVGSTQFDFSLAALLLWKNYISQGELDCAEKISYQLLTFYLNNKYLEKGIYLLGEIRKSKKNYSVFEYSMLIKLLAIKGDYVEVEKILDLASFEIETKYELAAFIDQEMIIGLSRQKVLEFIIESYIAKLMTCGKKVISARRIYKNLMNTMYQYLIVYPDGSKGLDSFIKCILFRKEKELISPIIRFCKMSGREEMVTGLDGFEQEEDDTQNDSSIDLGEDLFLSDGSYKIRVLERDIKFLMNKGMIEQAKELAKELSSYDSENTLLMDVTRLLAKSDSDKRDHKSLDQVETDLLEKIAEFTTVDMAEEELVVRLAKSIEYLSDEDIAEKGMNLLVSFHSMECFDAANELIGRIDGNDLFGNSLSNKLAYEYLRLTIYIGSKKFHDALVRCDEIVRLWPLKEDEKVIFLYLMGEIYLCQNKRDWALGVFRGVYAINDKYKAVELRIKELEGR